MKRQSLFRNLRFTVISLLFAFTVIAGCGSDSFQATSRWASAPINVKASSPELQQALTRIEDKQVMVGFLNDSNYLYVSLVTTDRSIQRQLLFRGFTVWFDRNGGEEKRFGIKFPLGMAMGDFRQMREEMNRDTDPDDDNRENTPRDSFMDRMPPLDTSEVEILGPKEGAHERLPLLSLKQIVLTLTVTEERLEYSMRVPLTDNGPDPYAIGTMPGGTIGVGLETATFQRPQSPGGEISGGMPGGMEGRGGPPGGGFPEGGPPGGRRMQRGESLNVWAKVTLASGK